MAALGEMWKGGLGQKNIVMVTPGTEGVGGGIIIDGQILTAGANGAGGEIGHICVNYEETDQCDVATWMFGTICICGDRNCASCKEKLEAGTAQY